MAIALLTPEVTPYRRPLFRRLAERFGVEVLCGLGPREAFSAARRYDAVIAGFAGGAAMPAAFLGARSRGRPFVLWASLWSQQRSLAHALALPLTRRIYSDADAVVCYGEHVRRFVVARRGRADTVFVAPQAVDAELFARPVDHEEVSDFRRRHGLQGELVLFVGRLVREKGIEVLLEAWRSVRADATLVLVGEGPLAPTGVPGVRALGALEQSALPAAYAAARCLVLPSIPTPRFKEPWGLVCNEAMHQGRPVIASDAVGAAAGGLVVDERSGLVVPAGDAGALAGAITRLLGDEGLLERLDAGAREAVRPYSYDAAVAGFERALIAAGALPARRS